MALSLCIGLLIDDAIVVRENIVRHFGMGKDHHQAAEDGTNEIGLAVMATTFAIVAVFIPVAFMDGIIGRFFLQFGITVAVAVLVSLFVSFTLDPMLSSVWPDPEQDRFKYVPWLGRLMDFVERGVDRLHVVYGKVLAVALDWRKTTLAVTAAIFAASLLLVPMIGGEMFPETDEGWVNMRFKTPVGSSLEYTNDKVKQVEAALAPFKEIDSILSNVGTRDGRNSAEVNLKLTDVKKSKRRSQKELEKAIRERLAPIAGIQLSVGQKPIFIAILGTDEAKLDAVARQLMDKMRAIKGVADLEYSQEGANPSTMIKINQELASDLGLSVQQIGAALRPFVAGEKVSHWLAADGQNYEVNVQLPKSGRQRVMDLADLSIAQRQMVEICKALMQDAQVIAFDEPTSSLSHRESEVLFRLVRELREAGRTIIYISHRLEELYALCDTCTIFRDGRKIVTHPVMAEVPRERLIADMVGRQVNDIYDYRTRPAHFDHSLRVTLGQFPEI
eukprot:gene28535-32228_t